MSLWENEERMPSVLASSSLLKKNLALCQKLYILLKAYGTKTRKLITFADHSNSSSSLKLCQYQSFGIHRNHSFFLYNENTIQTSSKRLHNMVITNDGWIV